MITASFSFNTVYASTQSSDAICTVLFLLSLLAFVRGHETLEPRRRSPTAALLSGMVPQFRPNMILLPVIVVAGYVLWTRAAPRAVRRLHCGDDRDVDAVDRPQLPLHRYRSADQHARRHQLWYGTLQVGPYLESRAHNPRSIFASPAFAYTSLETPIMVAAGIRCKPEGAPLRLAYRTDRDAQVRWLEPRSLAGRRNEFEIPAQVAPTTVYYFFGAGDATTPVGGNAEPFIYFVSNDHLGDLDSRHELLDIFDVVRLARHLAWQEPLPEALDLTKDGKTDAADLAAAVAHLLPQAAQPYQALDVSDRGVVLRLTDGSGVDRAAPVSRQADRSGG